MAVVESLQYWFASHAALGVVALGSGVLGAISGGLGTFAVLRKQSLIGDAISHAALPGIAIAFLVSHSKSPLPLVAGAAVAGWLATLLVMAVVRGTRIKHDSALGLVMSVFFGLGLLLVTYIQKHVPDASQAGLKDFLFGQAATLLWSDVLTMAVLGSLALATVTILWKEFKLLTFDPDYAVSLGLPVRRLDAVLTTLLVLAIVIGLQAVGAVLMSTLLVAPAAAARQWTNRLGRMTWLAVVFGALAGASGALLSHALSGRSVRIPTGPTIVLCASVVVIASLLLAPQRGLLGVWWGRLRDRRKLHLEAVLADLHELSLQHENPDHGHPVTLLQALRGPVDRSLAELERQGWARLVDGGWALTAAGRAEAERRAQERSAREPT
jgi:manganese/zinc/iron transport system permease protein